MLSLAVVSVSKNIVSSDSIALSAKSPRVVTQKPHSRNVFYRREALSKPLAYYSKVETFLGGKRTNRVPISGKFLAERVSIASSAYIVGTKSIDKLFNLTDLGFGKTVTITPTKTTVSVQRIWATRLVDRLGMRHVSHSVEQSPGLVLNTTNFERSQLAPTLATQKGTSRRAND